MLDSVGGAAGVLFGTIFISGITKADYKKDSCETEEIAKIFFDSLTSLKQRGKAKVGDKTMVDALEPAILELVESSKNQKTVKECFDCAALKAYDGMIYTKSVVAKFGRAKYYGEKAIGLQDAGATTVWILFKSLAEYMNK